MIVWIVGKVTEFPAWEFQGVFSGEREAIRACCANENFFIGPATLDQRIPTTSVEWRGAYYPNRLTPVAPDRACGSTGEDEISTRAAGEHDG